MHQDQELATDDTDATVDAVCVGETMALLVPEPVADGQHPRFRLEIGGAESNVAVHLARLGHRTAWRSALGADEFGRHVATRLTEEGVRCVVRTDPWSRTGLYVKELGSAGTQVRYYRTGSAASTLALADAPAVWQHHPRLLHTTGITVALSTDTAKLVHHLLESAPNGVLRSFDVNYRSALHGSEDGTRATPEYAAALLRAAQCADVVFCGLDESTALWGVTTITEVRELLDAPELVVVKQGAGGATALRGAESYFVPAPPVEVVEPVGAGDAFAAGVLHGLLSGDAVETSLRAGTRLAGAVLGIDGDIPPRPAPAPGSAREPDGAAAATGGSAKGGTPGVQ